MTQLLRKFGGVIILVIAGVIGAIPAFNDDDDFTTAAAQTQVTAPAGDSVIPTVPAGVAPAIADAVRTGVPIVGGSGGAGGTAGSSASGASTAPSASPAAPPSVGGPPPAPATGEVEVARVTGLSFVLDVFEIGSGIGFDTIYGLVVSAFGTIVPTDQLPPEFISQAYEILAVPPAVFDQFAEPTTAGFAAFRASLAPLAATNPAVNSLLTAMSEALIRAGTEGAALTNPLDAQVVQLGQFLLVVQE